MKNTLFFLFLLLAGKPLFAQPLQTLYYPDGRKFIEGHWTYTKRDFLSQRVRLEGQSNGFQIQSPTEGRVPDGDTALMQRHQWQDAQNPIRYLNIVPEGLLTCWIYEGGGYLQLNYKGGVPNGPFKEYYAPGQPLQEGTVLNGMPNGPWTYYYKNGKPLYTGHYKAYSQSQMEDLWAGNNTGLKANSTGSRNYWQNNLSEVIGMGLQMGVSMPFNNLLMTGTQKHGTFTYWHKDGTKWAEIAFDMHQPAGTWKVWEAGMEKPKLILELAGSTVAFVTDSTGRRRSLAQTQALLKARMDEARALLPQRFEVPAGEKPVAPAPHLFTYVEQMPTFKGSINKWLTENLRYPPAAKEEYIDGRVIIKFLVQEDGRVTDAKVEKGVRPDLDAEALRLINAMPAWEPGRQNGEAVMVGQRVTVKFSAE